MDWKKLLLSDSEIEAMRQNHASIVKAAQKEAIEKFKQSKQTNAPSIAELPESWRERIEAIREAHAEEIASYHEIIAVTCAAESEVKAARTFFDRFCSNIAYGPIDQKERQQLATAITIKEKDVVHAQNAKDYTRKQLRCKLEMSLAEAFIDELGQCCAQQNPQAFLEETGGMSLAEIKPYLLQMLHDPTPPSLPNWALEFPDKQKNSATICQNLAPPQKTNHDHNKTSQSRLSALEDSAEPLDRSKQNGDTLLSLSDTINGIWTEYLHPCIKKPAYPQLPHIYSVIEELMGEKQPDKSLPNQKVSIPEDASWSERMSTQPSSDSSIQSL